VSVGLGSHRISPGPHSQFPLLGLSVEYCDIICSVSFDSIGSSFVCRWLVDERRRREHIYYVSIWLTQFFYIYGHISVLLTICSLPLHCSPHLCRSACALLSYFTIRYYQLRELYMDRTSIWLSQFICIYGHISVLRSTCTLLEHIYSFFDTYRA